MTSRRTFLAAAAGLPIGLQAQATRQNLLIITNDQHRADVLGCYGNHVVRTPAIDRLASQGTLFENHFVQAPQCVPSRASMLTGRYPHAHRTLTNSYEFPATETTLPTLLQRAGYRTAAVGEMPFAPQKVSAGFSEIVASGREYDEFLTKAGWRGKVSPQRAALLAEQKAAGETRYQAAASPWPAELDETAFWASKACDFLEANRTGPFYLHVNFRRPHHPFDPPAPFDTMYDGVDFPPSFSRNGEMGTKPDGHAKALKNSVGFDLTKLSPDDLNKVKSLYYGMVTLNDKYIGVILEKLSALGLEDNTIVVFNADHGEMLGDHGLLFKGSYMYDEVLRVPLIIRAPGRMAAGKRVPELVEEVDLCPTLLELMNIPLPSNVQGRSLATKPGKRAVFAEFPTLKMVRTRDWKLVHYTGARPGELYDLRNDPHELTNLWASPEHSLRRAELEAALVDWFSAG